MENSLNWSSQIVIGKYIPSTSILHRMDPRAKLTLFILFLAVLSFTHSVTLEMVWLVALFLLLYVGKIPVRYFFSGLRPALPLLFLFMLLQLFFLPVPGATHFWLTWSWFKIGPETITLIVSGALRFIVIFLLIQLLTASTSLTDLAHAFEQLLSPLAKLRLPVHEVAIIIVIAVRFVPTFAAEADKIRRAQAARGADIGTAKAWQVIKRTKSVFPILLPLFILAINRAEDLVLAMEARGFVPGGKRTRYITFAWRKRDTLGFVLGTVFTVLMGVWQFYR